MLGEIFAVLKQRQGKILPDTKNVGVKKISQQIFEIILQHPGINAQGISKAIKNKTKRTIERHLATLKAKDMIEYRGAAKTGGYYVIT